MFGDQTAAGPAPGVRVPAFGPFSYALTVDEGSAFIGTIELQVAGPGGGYDVVVDNDGLALRWTGTEGAPLEDEAATGTVVNDHAKARTFRFNVTTFDAASDPIAWDLVQPGEEEVEAVAPGAGGEVPFNDDGVAGTDEGFAFDRATQTLRAGRQLTLGSADQAVHLSVGTDLAGDPVLEIATTPNLSPVTVRAATGATVQMAGGPHQATVLLTNAQIIALRAVPIQIVAAPGPNKVLLPVMAAYFLDWTADYGGIDADASITVALPGENLALAYLLNNAADGIAQVTGLLAAGHDVMNVTGPNGFFSDDWAVFVANQQGIATSLVADTALSVLASNDADFTDGNAANTLRVTVRYFLFNLETGLFE